jgi:aminomethyltransferase
VLVSTTGYTGGPGYELYLAARESEALFAAILDAGEREGVRPAGLGARDTLRLEAALPLYGHELDDETGPIEAGLERFVKQDQGGFIGAEGLIERAEDASPRRLAGFEMTGRGIARADYEIVHDGAVVGRVTSGGPSPTLGKSIGLGYVPRSLSTPGQALAIRIRKKDVEARVVELPFYRA